MLPHLLERCSDAHLAACNSNNGVEKIQVRQLTVNSIIDNVNGLESVIEWVVNDYSSLQGTTLDW